MAIGQPQDDSDQTRTFLGSETGPRFTRVAERFQIIRLLGQGGMGEVYEAQDLELNERIALKTIRTLP